MTYTKRNSGRGGFLRALTCLLQKNRLGDLLVLKGLITENELQGALVRQRTDNTPLGRVLLAQQLISRRQLYRTLGHQWTLRCLAGVLGFMIAFSSMGFKNARAASLRDIPAQLKLTSAANAAFGSLTSYPALFGAREKSSANISAFTKWTSMFGRFETAAASPQGRKVIESWKKDLAELEGLPLETLARKVNDLVNAQEYILDDRNWGKSDYWATPVEFFTRGGDCEDFAIAKYVSLRALGVPEERLRVAIVHDKVKDIPHAVLIVYADSGAYVLDNQVDEMRAASSVSRYRPIFSINSTAWWLHTAPGTNPSTVVASAE